MEVQDNVESIVSFTTRDLYDIMRDCKGKKIEEKLEFLGTKLVEITQCPDYNKTILDRTLRFFKTQFKQKWVAASRKEDRFLRNNDKWLKSSIQLQKFSAELENLSKRSKRQKTSEIRKQKPAEELIYAAGVSQRIIGNTDASARIKGIVATPTRASKVRKSYTLSQNQISVKKHTPQYRLDFSREYCNRDIVNRLLLSSDPYLGSIRPKPQTSKLFPFSFRKRRLI